MSNNLQITVHPKTLIPPVVDAGPNITVQLPQSSVSITAVATDDGVIVSYLWQPIGISIGNLQMTGLHTDTLTLSNLTPGVYEFMVVVTDDDGLTASDTVTVTIVPPNQEPVIVIPSTFTVDISPYSGDLDSSYDIISLGGNVYRYKLSVQKAQLLQSIFNSDGNSGVLVKSRKVNSVGGDLAVDDTYHIGTIQTIYTTGGGGVTGFVDIHFADGFNPTSVNKGSGQGSSASVQLVFQRRHVVLDASSSFDPDGTITAWLWEKMTITPPDECTLHGETTSVVVVRSIVTPGTYVINVSASDNGGDTTTQSVTLNVISQLLETGQITGLGMVSDSNDVEIGPLFSGMMIDISTLTLPLTLPVEIAHINGLDTAVTAQLNSIDGTQLSSFTEDKEGGTGVVTAAIDVPAIDIGDQSNPFEVILLISTEDSKGGVVVSPISIFLYNSSVSTGKALLIVRSEINYECYSEREVEVRLPDDSERQIEVIASTEDPHVSVTPSPGTISETTTYTLKIEGKEDALTVRDWITLRVKNLGEIEATTTLMRAHSGETC